MTNDQSLFTVIVRALCASSYYVSVARIDADLLADIIDAAAALNPGDSLSPRVLRAIASHSAEQNIRRSAETGAGGSTLLFSHLSGRHTAFTVEGNNKIIARVRGSLLFRNETADFVEGPTQRTLPVYEFDEPLDAVLIDGPHAFPFPQMEYFYFYPHLGTDGLLIVDDIHIRSVHDFYRFLRSDAMFELIDVVERTAFFRRTSAPVFDPWDDGWWLQPYNRGLLTRYTWGQMVKQRMPHQLRQMVKGLVSGITTRVRRSIRIEHPLDGSSLGPEALVSGRAELPPDAFLWLFARRADLSGWWPQGGAPANISRGRWEQRCKFGEDDDAGHAFEIAAVALDERRHRRVLRWFAESARLGRWDPMPLPEAMPGTCVARIRALRAGETKA